MKLEARAKCRQDGCLHIAVASQPIIGFHGTQGTFGTGSVLALNSQSRERVNTLLDSGFEFSSFRTRLFRSPHSL